MANATGRGLKKPRIKGTWNGDRLLIRIDDDDNPEFWFQLALTYNEVRALADGQSLNAGDDHWERENPNACPD